MVAWSTLTSFYRNGDDMPHFSNLVAIRRFLVNHNSLGWNSSDPGDFEVFN